VVVGPECVVEARVPATIGADNVVGGGGDGGDEKNEGTCELP